MHARHCPSIALILGLAVACRGGDPKTDPADGSADGGADGADGGADGSDGGADGGRDSGDSGDSGTPAPSEDPAEALLAALEAASAEPLRITDERGRITWIDADLPLPAGDDPFAAARGALGPWASLWHLGRPDRDLVPDAHSTDDTSGMSATWFSVRAGDIPVYGARVGIFAQDGRVKHLVGTVPRAPLSPRAPTLSASLASRGLVAEGWTVLSDPSLAFYDASLFGGPESGAALTYMVRVWSAAEGSGLAFVDADTGEQRGFSAEQRDWNVTVNSAKDNGLGADCWWLTDDDTWFEDDDHSLDDWPGTGADPWSDGPKAFEGIHGVLNWWQVNMGRIGWDGEDGDHDLYVQVAMPFPNAGWNGGCQTMQFSRGYVTDDIVGHEFMHAVNDDENGLIYAWEPGAIDEGLADVFGELTAGEDTWLHGEDLDPAVSDRTHRDLYAEVDGRPKVYDANAIAAKPLADDSGGVHTYSSLVSRSWLLMTDFHGRTLANPSPGMAMSDLLCLTATVTYHWLPPISSLVGLRNAFVGSLRGGACNIPATAENLCTVHNAFADVGLGPPDADCDGAEDPIDDDDDGDGVADAADNCPGVSSYSQKDQDGDGVGDACDPDIDGDGFANASAGCPLLPTATNTDADGDGKGDQCDDSDGDGYMAPQDNCPNAYNPGQPDLDGDGLGDACDADIDGDGIDNETDYCMFVYTAGINVDGDADGVGDQCDVCPYLYDPDQDDCDGDGVGAACTGASGADFDAEQACLKAKEAEELAESINNLTITMPPANQIPLPSCIACGPWSDPSQGFRVEVHSAARTDVWAIQDQFGRQVAWSKADLRTGAGVSMTVTPAHGDRAVVPGTEELIRGTTYTLVQVVGAAPATVEYSVTPR